jgi:retinol dehydrogenase-12
MAGPPTLTPSGYESNFGTNHMGHALLLRLLLPLLEKSPSPRVIFMASRGHSAVLPPGGIIFDRLKTPQEDIPGVLRYTSSKLANVVYARQVAVKYPHIVSVAIHPEDVATELFTKGVEGGGPEMEYLAREVAPKVGVSVFEGAKHGLWAATTEGVESGRYYEPVGMLGKGSELSRNKEFGDKLWEWTEKELERVEM